MRFVFMILAALSATFLSGCQSTSTYRDWSAGSVGCAPEEIEIRNEKGSVLCGHTATWTAICDDRTYICSNATGGGGDLGCSNSIRCTPKRRAR